MRRSHRVENIIKSRARTMRHEPAPAEEILWRRLRDRQLNGLKFRRQYPLATFILDFYCREARLVIELDGDSHSGRLRYDEQRTRQLESHKLQVIRFRNGDVFEHVDSVLEEILRAAESRLGRTVRPSPLPSPPSTGERGQ